MNIPEEVRLDLETKSAAFKRGALDCYQDRCENVPFSSIGGLDQRSDPMKPPSYVADADADEWLAGYAWEAQELFGDDWRTCQFGWSAAITLDPNEKPEEIFRPMERGSVGARLRAENRRLLASLSAIHDRLHAGEVDAAHALVECALGGGTVSQPNLSVSDSAKTMTLAAEFNALVSRHNVLAACVALIPSATVPNAVSIQICGEVKACKFVETKLRGSSSTYMGEHADG